MTVRRRREAVLAAAVLVVVPGACTSAPAPAPEAPSAAAAFVDAYERSRTATFVLEQTFTRSAPDGELRYSMRVAQRPPDDRLTVGGGNASGKVDGRVVRCATEPSGTSRCFEGPPAGDDAEAVAREVEDLRTLVEGDPAVYDVALGDDGCFELSLGVVLPSPPYGLAATFCFDEATGAPVRRFVDHGEGITDLVVTDELRTEVTPADLRADDLGELPVPG